MLDPLDFLAEITQHIHDPGMQMIRYYGWYFNKMRGQRKNTKHAESAKPDSAAIETDNENTPYRKLAKMCWAALIKRVYEADPLKCPECGGAMAIISFIEKRDQADVIQKILKHCGLWNRPATRAPPQAATQPVQPPLDLEYVDIDEPRRSRDGLPSRKQWSEAEWQFMMAL